MRQAAAKLFEEDKGIRLGDLFANHSPGPECLRRFASSTADAPERF
jgi:hypothetical protein